jgi:hypothetical protein
LRKLDCLSPTSAGGCDFATFLDNASVVSGRQALVIVRYGQINGGGKPVPVLEVVRAKFRIGASLQESRSIGDGKVKKAVNKGGGSPVRWALLHARSEWAVAP